MRLLPTSGDGADDMSSARAPSPSHYNYEPDYDHTPYVLPASPSATLYFFTFQWFPSLREPHSPSTLSHYVTWLEGKPVLKAIDRQWLLHLGSG
jgi:hypothetical protein